ncbi:hypothetical protein Cyrtocomes_01197 [Candidatus Cyrtobacter comes]|uniref:RES domain-containing protein n=1 Tax=Candidatus Cyrtobacter comes TaxID=675776 RepID=A0ABU5L9R7_9RICK|nr:hypothetical protein [Candidatus Cyrtobacter comes]MDZ5762802.1 hypothetical protein [Candidatus Cyrtobacter comes]
MPNSKNIMNKSSITKTGVYSTFFTARYNTTTDSGEYAFHSAISKMLKKCVTNQGESPSGSATYKPFNPLYSTKSDHHTLIGFGTYKNPLTHDPRITSYYAYDYNEKHSNLVDFFHQAIRKCFGMNNHYDAPTTIVTDIQYHNNRKYIVTRMVMVQDEAEKLYSPYDILRRGLDADSQFTTCSIKGDNHYYGFVLYNEDGASCAYEANACYKDFNPLIDIESCINAYFGNMSDI